MSQHTFCEERFSENFDKKAETYLLLDHAVSFDLGDLRRASGDFFKDHIFKIRAFQPKR